MSLQNDMKLALPLTQQTVFDKSEFLLLSNW